MIVLMEMDKDTEIYFVETVTKWSNLKINGGVMSEQ